MSREWAPWSLAGAEVVGANDLRETWIWSRVRPAPLEIAVHIMSGGLEIAMINDSARDLFVSATRAIEAAPDLAAIIERRVAAIHGVEAEPGYDVSHSEPIWADRIFVSLPERADAVGALRLAESIVHEGMHLHLTRLEARTPLVVEEARELPSPWRQAPRPAAGVLHGLFVFSCVDAWLARAAPVLSGPTMTYAAERRSCIAGEVAEIDRPGLEAELTASGRRLLASLFI